MIIGGGCTDCLLTNLSQTSQTFLTPENCCCFFHFGAFAIFEISCQKKSKAKKITLIRAPGSLKIFARML